MSADTWPRVGDAADEIPDPDPVPSEPGTELVPVDPAGELVATDEHTAALPMVQNLREVKDGVRPVIPGWLRDGETFKATLVWAGRRSAHLAGFHAIRTPVYAGRVAFVLAPIGVGRLTRQWVLWVSDADGRAVRANMASGSGSSAEAFYRVTEQKNQTVKGRFWLTVGVGLSLAAGAWFLAMYSNLATFTLAAVIVVGILAVFGRTPGHGVLSHSTSSDVPPRLSETLILTALSALGIGELNGALRAADKLGGNAAAVGFPAPITRDGPGFRADIDLPPGVTAGQVVERRERLASGLRRPLAAVWPQSDGDSHAGRLILWVGDKPMSMAKPVAWTLAKRGTVDLFAPFPIGVDPQGRPVHITLMFALMVIGAQPRMGKSFFLRLLLLAAALDPRCEIHVYDLKGGADFIPLEPVAHRIGIGDDDQDIAHLLTDARDLADDMSRRYKVVRRLPRDICPEGKITPDLASRRDLSLHPVILALDECQRAFEHPEHGKELEAVITDLAKRGPAVGIIVILATQRPDAKSLPTGISSNAVLRFCLRVADQTANDMVMGTSSYKAGIRATMFSRKEMGVGYLAGEADDPTITRTAYVDGAAAEEIVARARAERQRQGRLTGQAAEEAPEELEATPGAVQHMLEGWPEGKARMQYVELAELLRERWPDAYAGWGAEQVSAACRAAKIPGVQVKRDGKNKWGVAREKLLEFEAG